MKNKPQQQERESSGLRRLWLEWADYCAAISGFPQLLHSSAGQCGAQRSACEGGEEGGFFFFFPTLQVASVSRIPDWSQENSGKHVNWPVTTATRSPSAAAKRCTTAANTWFTPSCWLNPESNTAATQDVLKRAIFGTGSSHFSQGWNKYHLSALKRAVGSLHFIACGQFPFPCSSLHTIACYF